MKNLFVNFLTLTFILSLHGFSIPELPAQEAPVTSGALKKWCEKVKGEFRDTSHSCFCTGTDVKITPLDQDVQAKCQISSLPLTKKDEFLSELSGPKDSCEKVASTS